MKEHNIELTSAEFGQLWCTYMNDSASIPILKYFLQGVDDLEIKPLIELALKMAQEHTEQIANIFINESYPIPIGFSDEDVNLDAPKLYSDTFILYFIRNLGKSALAAYGMAFSLVPRSDIVELFSTYIDETKNLEKSTKEVMLSKGLFIRSPYIAQPTRPDFIEKQSFLKGWFGERRTLTAVEISHLYMNHQNNTLGKALVLGFAQVAQSEELREFFVRGVELSKKIFEDLRTILEESTLPAPMTWDTEVKESTIAPISDKLMLFLINALTAISIGNMGGSLALCLRRDLTAKYANLIKDVGLYAEDGANIMIKNGWFERPPQAMDREFLTKGKSIK
ncbi:hypothetical protein JOC85_000851 [Bacillus mesophilus]|uniref:DUF3231 family protein n=1 Tax=Bacillus mesophilus TaxID=1808955 RepID=A0A6M0QD89_9BACI|nr:DUF3231 family protein [Bacillus mesophilus]MBM7660084.1 hypothetical protein [Bacillus mesophilus]NEY73739.1 DUF3231 family protein [Bacillus mesophilus]